MLFFSPASSDSDNFRLLIGFNLFFVEIIMHINLCYCFGWERILNSLIVLSILVDGFDEGFVLFIGPSRPIYWTADLLGLLHSV